MANAHIPALEALNWIRSGFERVRGEPARWLGMTLVYLIIALALKYIPFLGTFLLVLLTPIMFGGALLALRSASVKAPADAAGWARALTLDGARELFQAFRREDHTFAIVIVCIVTLGLCIMVNIPELLITGGSIISGLQGANIAGSVQPTTLIGLAIVTALYLLLAMALFFLIPLTLFGERQPIPAVAESFHAVKQNAGAVALFVAPFLVLNLLIIVMFGVSRPLGYLLLLTAGLCAIPVFVAGLHESYRTVFEAIAPAAAAPLNQRVAP
jgi:hypothetical protein